MFKLTIYSKRTLNSIPPFGGPARRVERPEAVPESSGIEHLSRTIGGGGSHGPARGSQRS